MKQEDELSPDTRAAAMTEGDIRAALCIHDPALVEELYNSAVRQIEHESKRQASLDGKATSLLTAIGLAITVTFTFGCQVLVGQADKLPQITGLRWVVAGILFWITVLAGLGSSFYAVVALRVSDHYRAVNERTIFNAEILRDSDEKEGRDEALTVYRRYVIPHLWTIAQQHLRVHDRKAKLVQRGQTVFLIFLCGLVVVFAWVSWLVFAGRSVT